MVSFCPLVAIEMKILYVFTILCHATLGVLVALKGNYVAAFMCINVVLWVGTAVNKDHLINLYTKLGSI